MEKKFLNETINQSQQIIKVLEKGGKQVTGKENFLFIKETRQAMASLCEFGANSRSPATAVIPVLKRLVQGHGEFQASLGHKVSLCLNLLPPAHTKKETIK